MRKKLTKILLGAAILGSLQCMGLGLQANAKELHPDGCPECRDGCHHWRFKSVEEDRQHGYVNVFECSKCGDIWVKP